MRLVFRPDGRELWRRGLTKEDRRRRLIGVFCASTTGGRRLRYRTWGFATRTRGLSTAFAEALGERLRTR